MTKQEFCQVADELELITRELKRVCEQYGLDQVNAVTTKASGWSSCVEKPIHNGAPDVYVLDISEGGHVQYEYNDVPFYIKS